MFYQDDEKDQFITKGNPQAACSICYVKDHYYVKDDNYLKVAKLIVTMSSNPDLRPMTIPEM